VGLQSSYHPLAAFPTWKDVASLPVTGQARALRDPSFRSRLLDDMAAGGVESDEGGGQRRPRPIAYGRLFALGDSPDYEPAPEASVARRAAAEGVDPAV